MERVSFPKEKQDVLLQSNLSIHYERWNENENAATKLQNVLLLFDEINDSGTKSRSTNCDRYIPYVPKRRSGKLQKVNTLKPDKIYVHF